MSSTTFGVRDGASWSFYSQIYYDDRGVTNYGTPKLPRKYFLKEVKRFL
jgi:hypothetical protein